MINHQNSTFNYNSNLLSQQKNINSSSSFTSFNTNIQQDFFKFNEDSPQEIAPSIWLGSFKDLFNQDFLNSKNIKIIVNCSATYKFLNQLELSNAVISSDVIILSLDLTFSNDKFSADEQVLLDNYVHKFNKILQNYMNHFYKFNPNSNNLIHKVPNNSEFSIGSPILSGNLKQHLFNVNRLIKLLKNINNSIEVLILSADGNSQLSTALAMSYLMDNYSYNLTASFNNLKLKRPSIKCLNSNYYDDLLIIENLKKFYQENMNLKSKNPAILMNNCKLKRRNSDDNNEVDSLIICGGERKRRFKYPAGI